MGVILFEFIMGRLPFACADARAVMRAKRTARPWLRRTLTVAAVLTLTVLVWLSGSR